MKVICMKENMMTTRRHFIRTVSGATLALATPKVLIAGRSGSSDRWGKVLPLKQLGSTGDSVTLLGLGGFHIGRMDDPVAEETIELAMKEGIRFFDTAESYQRGVAEVKYGKFLSPKYRDEVFLMTKTRARNYKTAEEHLHGSLKRLGTDRLDLWLMHSIENENDVKSRLQNGVLKFMIEARSKGLVRHIGFSGHTTTGAHLSMLEQSEDVEVCMMPVNVVDTGYDSFINKVLPELKKRKKGVIAMKTLSGGAFFGRGFDGAQDARDTVIDHISVEEAITYALSVPNDVLVTGPKSPEMLQEKINIVNQFQRLSDGEMESLFRKVEHLADGQVEYYKE
jgi:predicted aldo/keto reductase-like oxidoreductase